MASRDRAAASIVGEVLVVAIVIAVVAGAAVFFRGITHQGQTRDATPPTAATLTSLDTDADFATDTLRILLVKSELAPFDPLHAALTFEGPAGGVSPLAFEDVGLLDPFADPSDLWREGGSLYAPCTLAGTHTVTLRTGHQVVWQRQVRCGGAWTPAP